MFKSELQITIDKQLTGRLVHQIVYYISELKSDVYISNCEGRSVNAKSIIGVLSLDVKTNDIVTIKIYNNISQKNSDTDINKIKDFIKSLN